MGSETGDNASLAGKQRGVALGGGSALVLTILIYLGAPLIPLPEGSSRTLVFSTAAIGPLICLLAAVGALGNRRFFSKADIDAAAGGPPSPTARIMQAILQNTLEQAVLSLGVYAVICILAPQVMSALPLLMSGAFVLGRLAFAIGYKRGAGGRAFGFGFTAYPAFFGLFYAIWLVGKAWF